MKKNITVSVDLEAYLYLRKQKLNISSLVSDFMTSYAEVKKPVVKGDTIQDKETYIKLQQISLDKELEKIAKEKKAQVERQKKWIPINDKGITPL